MLACVTGVPMREWMEDEQAMVTALNYLSRPSSGARVGPAGRASGGEQWSG